MPRRLLRLGAFLAVGGLVRCGTPPQAPTQQAPPPTGLTAVPASAEWPASTPEAEGLDPAPLTSLVESIRRRERGTLASLLVVRNGRLVVEEYFYNWSASELHTLQSVTKSVTSLLTGIAVQEGRLGLGDKLVGLFPEYQPIRNLDDRKAAMSVRDLLTMRTGLDWNEWPYAGSPLEQLNQCRCDWLRFVLDWPMREPPGTRWQYVSGGVILLGGAVGVATGHRIDLLAADRLFAPLGIERTRWYSGLPDGLPHTGGGLYLRPRDTAKLGQLVLDGGRWRGAQVIAEDWIRESTQRVTVGVNAFGRHPVDYGYLWWLLSLEDPMNPRPEPGDVITASGAQGQWIFVVPRHRLVVVVNAENDADFLLPLDFLYTHLLAAVRT